MPSNVLLLQGPVGPFFARFAQELSEQGSRVYKVNFNAGDRYFYSRPGAFEYQGAIDGWRDFLEKMIVRLAIARIYVFGDCRIYHEIARKVAAERGIRFFVFEEGYLRPDYITLEEDGVNGHSSIRFEDSSSVVALRPDDGPRFRFPRSFFLSGWYAVQYYVAARLGSHFYPFYRHHRPLNVFGEGSKWLVSGWRKVVYSRASRRFDKRAAAELSQRYFLVPLQVHVDMQVRRHSNFSSVEGFIETVMASFARSAPADVALVFKHHPHDRGYRNYSRLIERLARRHDVAGRVHYVFDSHLPTLLKHALGTVTINSTVGLSSLHHGVPVKVMGQAVYDRAGLTFSGELDDFWGNPGKVNGPLYQKFRRYLLDTNQMNGSFYQRGRGADNPTGMAWSPYLLQQHCKPFSPPARERGARPKLVRNSVA